MASSKEFTNLVKELSLLIAHSQESFQPSERNEEWTKAAIIVPLLEGLGWDKAKDIGYENSPGDVERIALSEAWEILIEKHTNNLIQLIRKDLPTELDIKDENILDLLKTLKLSKDIVESPRPRTNKLEKSRSFPDDWKQLLESYEPYYDRARKRFLRGNYVKLGAYILSANYKPWSKAITWRHVGVPNDTNERKKLGIVISLFLEWRFIEEVRDTNKKMYKRVEESIPYLKQLLRK